jgi:hypothetical protein
MSQNLNESYLISCRAFLLYKSLRSKISCYSLFFCRIPISLSSSRSQEDLLRLRQFVNKSSNLYLEKQTTTTAKPVSHHRHVYYLSPNFSTLKEPKNRFQGTNSARLCSLADRNDNPIPTRFLAPIVGLKIPALELPASEGVSKYFIIALKTRVLETCL